MLREEFVCRAALQKKDLSLNRLINIAANFEAMANALTLSNSNPIKEYAEFDGARTRRFRCEIKHTPNQKCWAQDQKCYSCNNEGHFARCCTRRRNQKGNANKVNYESDVEEISNIYAIAGKKIARILVRLNCVPIEMQFDTGAAVNEKNYECGELVEVTGKCTFIMEYGEFKRTLDAIVSGSTDKPLFELPWALNFGLHIPADIIDVAQLNLTRGHRLISKTCLKANLLGVQNFMAKLCVSKDAVPTAWPSRRILYSLQSAVKEEIKRMAGRHTLSLLHEGHPGENAMKSLPRDMPSLPDNSSKDSLTSIVIMGLAIERLVTYTRRYFWSNKRTVISGGRGCKMQMPEMWKSVNWNTSKITARLNEVFARWGILQTIVSDNSLHFASSMFNEWYANLGISHAKASPYHPQTNGLAERLIETLKNMVLKHGNDWADKRLNQFMLCYRNTTHPSRGKLPAEVMIGRRLPHVRSSLYVYHKQRKQLDIQHQDGSSRGLIFNIDDKVWYYNNKTLVSENYCETKRSGILCSQIYNRRRAITEKQNENPEYNPTVDDLSNGETTEGHTLAQMQGDITTSNSLRPDNANQ
ncbi:hypothetical protein GJ496_000593 [Pomphorhynchus laevis]|nr:hypothetical protein GJ496_000593 [Pomphorhynchus laevis]